MPFESPRDATGWSARLALEFARRGERTYLSRRAHEGPLHLQKPLYPEDPAVCHAILVHPPAGIAGGDVLEVDVDVATGAHALVTTPGATKWYRTRGPVATQSVRLRVAERAVLEWLPQESIVFAGAKAHMTWDVSLARDATFVSMEVLCLGRPASGERFDRGEIATSTRFVRDGAPVWIERGVVQGNDRLLDSPMGFAGEPVVGTLLAVSPDVDASLRDACREIAPRAGRGAVTLLPGLLVARYLGPSCEPARSWLSAVWSRLRPVLTGRAPTTPRIWNT